MPQASHPVFSRGKRRVSRCSTNRNLGPDYASRLLSAGDDTCEGRSSCLLYFGRHFDCRYDRAGNRTCERDRNAIANLARDRVRSEDHTSELQSLMRISYAVLCLKKKMLSILITLLLL